VMAKITGMAAIEMVVSIELRSMSPSRRRRPIAA
jgi:hypothetical protein